MKTKPSYRRLFWSLCAVVMPSLFANGQDILDTYVQEGLKNNVVAQQQQVSLQQAENALRIARSYFMPNIQLLADYTHGDGGRSISLPVGDLLNPVYQSLNQLTGSDAFPQIANAEENFFPKNFYDTRVRTSLPLLNTDLLINQSIKSKQLAIQRYELKSYERTLAFQIQEAYYRYLSAKEAVKIYEGALVLLAKNVQINESLKRNGMGLPANVLRAQSELQRVSAENTNAINALENSKRYFNFLLNRDLEATINEDYSIKEESSENENAPSLQQREEITQLKIAQEISVSTLRMAQLNRLPKVNAFVDLGSQATNWAFNDKSTYYLVGMQLSVPIFQGMRNNLSVRQSKLDIQKSELALQNASKSIQLAVDIAENELKSARENCLASKEQLSSATSYFNLIEKGYLEGVNSLIEFLDARNQLTTSELLNNVTVFNMLIAKAKLERETASLMLNK